ncbi:UNVERIFIED_CONTAM: hypothetical protein Sradi_6224300 [Sesamum radiatum]|uniref:Reverse transcriptase zinc-binding domain-containing protein n=1 Tax=Sesamum radiatum TaxID=300843 RepID=A0AAW2KBI3_SESRA
MSEMDADCILGIALPGASQRQDELIWHFVRSAYRVAIELRQEDGCSLSERDWKFIWKSIILPKVAMFVWRCMLDVLPTTDSLNHKGAKVDAGCGRCDDNKEDMLHVLFHCNYARLVWALSGFDVMLLFTQTTVLKYGFERFIKNWGVRSGCFSQLYGGQFGGVRSKICLRVGMWRVMR